MKIPYVQILRSQIRRQMVIIQALSVPVVVSLGYMLYEFLLYKKTGVLPSQYGDRVETLIFNAILVILIIPPILLYLTYWLRTPKRRLRAREELIIQIATTWRQENGYTGKGGVIVIFDRVVNSWVDTLRDPRDWAPGCIAVDESGNEWISTGGDGENGAERWEPIREEAV